MERGYGEYCAIARALDVLGSRWALLVIRELSGGPRRYSDLLAGMPEIGTSVLTKRLQDLRDDGLVEQRRLPPPAGSAVYELSERGREALPILFALARWGTELLGVRKGEESTRAYWSAVALAAWAEPGRVEQAGLVEIKSSEEDSASIRIDRGEARAVHGSGEDPDLIVRGEPEQLAALRTQGLDRVELEGRSELLEQLLGPAAV